MHARKLHASIQACASCCGCMTVLRCAAYARISSNGKESLLAMRLATTAADILLGHRLSLLSNMCLSFKDCIG
jgi:hypothetical protein